MKLVKNPFNTYRVTYGIVSHDTTQFKDYARIDCFNGTKSWAGAVRVFNRPRKQWRHR